MTQLPIPEQIAKLDALYREALDRLEAHAKDADILDKQVRRILDQPDTNESILEFHPELALPPRLAYRALALQLVRIADEQRIATRDVSPLDYEDLLSWETEPRRIGNMTMLEEVQIKLAYARKRTLQSFWDRYTLRIAPGRDPVRAASVAVTDLVEAISVKMPETVIVPFLEHHDRKAFFMTIPKSVGELEWVLQPPAISGLARTLHAFVTLCRAIGQHTAAELMQDTCQSVQTTLKTTNYRYRPREMYWAGDILRMMMMRDHIEFRFDPAVFAAMRQQIVAQTGLTFVRAPRTYS